MLTAAQQDYIETIYRLELTNGPGKVRISDIAEQLGTRMPTVTRTVQKLTAMGYVSHISRRTLSLTPTGRTVAAEIVHRHEDLVRFFVDILGISPTQAQIDTCQMEHGVSGKTAQRLHEFLQYFDALDKKDRMVFTRFLESVTNGKQDFMHLPGTKTNGWRS